MTGNIMECKTVQTTVFKTLVEALKDILTDVNINLIKEAVILKKKRTKDISKSSQWIAARLFLFI